MEIEIKREGKNEKKRHCVKLTLLMNRSEEVSEAEPRTLAFGFPEKSRRTR